MRLALLLAAAAAFGSTGCAAAIAKCGKDPESLTAERLPQLGTVEAAFGQPEDTVVFRTHCKIAEPNRAGLIVVRDSCTPFALAEIVEVPCAFYRVGRTALCGSEVQVRYDGYGRVATVVVDGDLAFQRMPPSVQVATDKELGHQFTPPAPP